MEYNKEPFLRRRNIKVALGILECVDSNNILQKSQNLNLKSPHVTRKIKPQGYAQRMIFLRMY